jgi:hypothetical protein
MNPFARQDWGLPDWIRDLITKRFGNEVKFFACGQGLLDSGELRLEEKR